MTPPGLVCILNELDLIPHMTQPIYLSEGVLGFLGFFARSQGQQEHSKITPQKEAHPKDFLLPDSCHIGAFSPSC